MFLSVLSGGLFACLFWSALSRLVLSCFVMSVRLSVSLSAWQSVCSFVRSFCLGSSCQCSFQGNSPSHPKRKTKSTQQKGFVVSGSIFPWKRPGSMGHLFDGGSISDPTFFLGHLKVLSRIFAKPHTHTHKKRPEVPADNFLMGWVCLRIEDVQGPKWQVSHMA